MSDSAAETEVERRHRRPRSGFLVFLRDLVVILLIALAVSWALKTFLIRSFYVPSGSMEPTLVGGDGQTDDRIIVDELVPKAIAVQHGDVVVFKDPGGWLGPLPAKPAQNWVQAAGDWLGSLVGLTAPDSDEHLVKRVIGLPGDTVACCTATGSLTVNGVPLDEPYIQTQGNADAAPKQFSVTVPADSLWMMGDNRYDSADSLAHMGEPSGGFVPERDVVGKAMVISMPISRWSVLSNYPATFAGVEDKHPDSESTDDPTSTSGH